MRRFVQLYETLDRTTSTNAKVAALEAYFRAAACTGNLHHIDLYVICADLPGLKAGVYHFGPHDGALRCLRAGDHRGVIVDATGEEPAARDAPVVLAFATTFWWAVGACLLAMVPAVILARSERRAPRAHPVPAQA